MSQDFWQFSGTDATNIMDISQFDAPFYHGYSDLQWLSDLPAQPISNHDPWGGPSTSIPLEHGDPQHECRQLPDASQHHGSTPFQETCPPAKLPEPENTYSHLEEFKNLCRMQENRCNKFIEELEARVGKLEELCANLHNEYINIDSSIGRTTLIGFNRIEKQTR